MTENKIGLMTIDLILDEITETIEFLLKYKHCHSYCESTSSSSFDASKCNCGYVSTYQKHSSTISKLESLVRSHRGGSDV